ncbi:hypothetical protein ACWCW7_22005 [Nocardia tengchongensis]
MRTLIAVAGVVGAMALGIGPASASPTETAAAPVYISPTATTGSAVVSLICVLVPAINICVPLREPNVG